jgi:hypothetical protein
MIDLDKPFFSIQEAAEILGRPVDSVSEAVRTGRFRAIMTGSTTASAAIPRSVLFPEADAADLKMRRIIKKTLHVRETIEEADRVIAQWTEANRRVKAALRDLEIELALDQLDLHKSQPQRQIATG